MRYYLFVLISFIILLFQIDLFAEINVYMLPEAEINGCDIHVSDICKIEGAGSSKYMTLVIPSGDYADGIIDQSELGHFLNETFNENVTVFGYGTKITFFSNTQNEHNTKSDLAVKKGEQVKITVRNGGIIITLKGKSLSDGAINDEVDVRLINGKRIKCIITGEKQARLVL